METPARWPRPVRVLVLLLSLSALGAYVGVMSCGGASRSSELLPATKAPAGPPRPAPPPAVVDAPPRFLGSSKSAPVFRPEDLPAQQAPAQQAAPGRR